MTWVIVVNFVTDLLKMAFTLILFANMTGKLEVNRGKKTHT